MNTSSDNPNPSRAADPLAVALAKLDPAPHGFDWNALMFAAGRASKARALVFWRVAAGAAALAACGFAIAYFTRPTVVIEHERTVFVDRAPAGPPPAQPRLPGPGPVTNPK